MKSRVKGKYNWFTLVVNGRYGEVNFIWTLKSNLVLALEEYLIFRDVTGVLSGDGEVFLEGRRVLKKSYVYERSRVARERCLISYGGYSCQICDFNFEQCYGDGAKDFIHVHHISALSDVNESYTCPERDLIPLCPNCHAVVHLAKFKGMSIQDIRCLVVSRR